MSDSHHPGNDLAGRAAGPVTARREAHHPSRVTPPSSRAEARRPLSTHSFDERDRAPGGPHRDAADRPGRHAIEGPLRRATAVVDEAACLRFQTPEAGGLLACIGGGSAAAGALAYGQPVPAPVQAVVRRLARAEPIGTEGGREPVRLRVDTSAGPVTIEAAWLMPADPHPPTGASPVGRLIAVRLELREDPASFAERALRRTGVTPAQVRVGVLLVLGKSKQEIARDLGVKPSSVEDAVRKLYARLDVHSAAELGLRLWHMPGET